MMQPVLRRWKINEETNLGVERGGSVQKNRRYIVLDMRTPGVSFWVVVTNLIPEYVQ